MPLSEEYAGFLRVNEKARRKLKDCGSTVDLEGTSVDEQVNFS